MNASLIFAGGIMGACGVWILTQNLGSRIGFPLLTGGFILIIVGLLGGCHG